MLHAQALEVLCNDIDTLVTVALLATLGAVGDDDGCLGGLQRNCTIALLLRIHSLAIFFSQELVLGPFTVDATTHEGCEVFALETACNVGSLSCCELCVWVDSEGRRYIRAIAIGEEFVLERRAPVLRMARQECTRLPQGTLQPTRAPATRLVTTQHLGHPTLAIAPSNTVLTCCPHKGRPAVLPASLLTL